MATLELIERSLVLEENDLAVGFGAGLKTRADEIHRGISGKHATRINATLSMSRAHDEAGAADGRKNGISIRLGKKCPAFTGLLEGVNGVLITIGTGGTNADTGEDQSREYGLNEFVHG
jgi:hypothetical protein